MKKFLMCILMFLADAMLEITCQAKEQDIARIMKYDLTYCAIIDSNFISVCKFKVARKLISAH